MNTYRAVIYILRKGLILGSRIFGLKGVGRYGSLAGGHSGARAPVENLVKSVPIVNHITSEGDHTVASIVISGAPKPLTSSQPGRILNRTTAARKLQLSLVRGGFGGSPVYHGQWWGAQTALDRPSKTPHAMISEGVESVGFEIPRSRKD